MKNLFVRFVREEDGQDLIEYSLLAALISVVSIGVDGSSSAATINAIFTNVDDRAQRAASVVGCPARLGAGSHRAGSVSQEEFTSHEACSPGKSQLQRGPQSDARTALVMR